MPITTASPPLAESSQALAPQPPEAAGSRKAAILLLAVGDEVAREIFKRLSEEEMRRLGQAAARLREIEAKEVVEVLEEFRETFGGGFIPALGADGVFRVMVERALGGDRARDLLTPARHEEPFAFCAQIEPGTLAMVLGREHPQTVAIVLSALKAEVSAQVLEKLGAQVSAQVVFRMAHLGSVNPEVIADISATLREEFEAMGAFRRRGESIKGQDIAVEILKKLPQQETDEVLLQIEATDTGFAQSLRGKLFIFEDLAALDPRTMQRLLREVDSKLLSVALKGAEARIQETFFGAMSSRASEMLRDDMEAGGPMRLADVEAAQQEILEVAMRLEAEGVILLPRGGGDGMV